MKLIHKKVDRNGEGSVKLVATESEDMYDLYNLIGEGSIVKATTIRKVQRQTATGSSESERMKITLTIEVSDVEFDSQGLQLRLKGQNIVENEHVKVGAFHTIEVELHRPFELFKYNWDKIDLEMLERACEPSAKADVAAILMQPGLAHIFVLSDNLSTVVARVETNIPRKGLSGLLNRDKAMEKFFEAVYRGIIEKLNLDTLKVLIIASPGFTKDEFFKYMNEEAARRDDKAILRIKPRTVLAHSSSGYKQDIHEVLSNPALASRLADTKAVAEVSALQKFFDILNNNPERACYGLAHVMYATEMGAVETLMITDALFRNSDVETRKKYVSIVDATRATGGDVHIFSAMHISGEQLHEMTGIAAILRFPLHDLEDLDIDGADLAGADAAS